MGRIFSHLKRIDWVVMGAVLVLVFIGLLEIYSVSLGRGNGFLNFQKQLLFVSGGLLLAFLLSFLDYNYLRNWGNYIYLIAFTLLLAVLFVGQTIRGTTGWFSLGFFSLQPVEFVKIALIIFLAKYFSSHSLKSNFLYHLFFVGLGAAVFFVLVLAQPDFGSFMILAAVWLAMIALAGFKKKYFFVIFLLLAVLSSFAWAFYLAPYQKQRILTFLNPSFDPLNQGYNVAQAIIAVGAGGLNGRGFGFGSQSQLRFLPESQNDFIFAVVGEEFGLLGAFLVVFLFTVFFFRALHQLKKINDDFGVFLVLGILVLIFTEMFINIGMNIGLLPVVGISLPFLSYGGSHMLATLMMVGIMESVFVRSGIK